MLIKELLLERKWIKTDPKKRGMFDGKDVSDLETQLANLKKKGPHKKGSPGLKKMHELMFAIRMKKGHGKPGKVNEELDAPEDVLVEGVHTSYNDWARTMRRNGGEPELKQSHTGEDIIHGVHQKTGKTLGVWHPQLHIGHEYANEDVVTEARDVVPNNQFNSKAKKLATELLGAPAVDLGERDGDLTSSTGRAKGSGKTLRFYLDIDESRPATVLARKFKIDDVEFVAVGCPDDLTFDSISTINVFVKPADKAKFTAAAKKKK